MSILESSALSSAIAALRRSLPTSKRPSADRDPDPDADPDLDLNPHPPKTPKPSPPDPQSHSQTLTVTQTLHFFVRSSSRTLVCHADPLESVGSLIARITFCADVDAAEHRLILSGRQLVPSETLSQSSVTNDSTLHLTGRLRSTRFPLTWRIVDDIIAASLAVLSGRRLHASSIPRLLKEFLASCVVEVNDDEDGPWHRLEVFLLAGAPAALVKLYLSPTNRSLASDTIHLFFNLESDWKLNRIWFKVSPIVLEFCRLLAGTVGRHDPLYRSCRCALATMLRSDQLELLRSSNVIHDVFPFVEELFDLISKGFSLDSVPMPVNLMREFARFLNAMYQAVDNWVGIPIPKRLLDEGCRDSEYWIGPLHAMFLKFLSLAAEQLKKVKEISAQRRTDVLLLLTQCNYIARIYEGAERLLQLFLLEQRVPVNFLLCRAKRNEELLWFLKYKDVTDFEARRNLVMMMFHEAKEDDNMFEMLIDRSQMLVESFRYIGKAKQKNLQGKIFLEFKNEEATGPGVLREWFCLLCREIFDAKNGLFLPCNNDRRRFFPNPESVVDILNSDYYGFCGRLIALALKHKVQVGIMFDRVFFSQLASRSVTLEDIQDADPCLYMSCKKILEMDADLLDSDALGLTFVMEVEELGSRRVVELCHGGKDITVNSKNREKYVNHLIQHRFVTSVKNQVASFTKGFRDIVCNDKYDKVFFHSLNLEDFDQMLGGSDRIICVTEWKAHTEYNGYKATDRVIRWFWKIVEGMSKEQRRMLLFFWTSVKYLPVDGFCGLGSNLYLYKSSDSKDCLPTSHTCFYRLCLPAYKSKSKMQERLLLITEENVSCSFGLW